MWRIRHGALSTIYHGVFTSIAEYAASGWANLSKEPDMRMLRSIQRRALLAITSVYRTASWERLCIIAGAILIDILLEKHRDLLNLRRGKDAEVRETLIPANNEIRGTRDRVLSEVCRVLQTRWNSCHRCRTMHAYFRDVKQRIFARWTSTLYYCTQALTGHGNFGSYLRERRISADEPLRAVQIVTR